MNDSGLHIMGDTGGHGLCCAFGMMQLLLEIHVHDELFLIHGRIVYVRFDSVVAS